MIVVRFSHQLKFIMSLRRNGHNILKPKKKRSRCTATIIEDGCKQYVPDFDRSNPPGYLQCIINDKFLVHHRFVWYYKISEAMKKYSPSISKLSKFFKNIYL